MKQAIVIVVAASLVLFAMYMMFMGMKKTVIAPEIVTDEMNVPESPQLTLESKTWEWVETVPNNGDAIAPAKTGVFKITFDEGQVAIGTDCNRGNTTYTTVGTQLVFGAIGSTKMYCEGAQEQDFFLMLRDVTDYHFSDDGRLILDLKFDSGKMVFI